MYEYKAIITSVYDGDTVTANIDLGFGVVLKKQKLRLYGIDTPEVRGASKEEGKQVRDLVREKILDKEVLIKTYRDKKGKYGRLLGKLFRIKKSEHQALASSTKSYNEILLEEGHAKEYFGGKK